MYRSTPPRAIAVAAPRPTIASRLLVGALLLIAVALAFPLSAHAATYYVSTTGSDSAAGTATAPWRTISPKLPALAGGDVVIFRNGTYTESIDLSLLPLTTTPVTIKAETSRGVTLKGGGAFFTIGSGVDVKGAVSIQGFKVTDGAMGIGFDRGGNNIEIKDCEVYGCIEGFRLRSGSNLRLLDSYIHDNQYGCMMGTKDVSGLNGILIEGCVAANNALAGQSGNTDGFVVEGMSTGLVIRDCVSHGAGDSGFDLKPAGTIMERCLSYNNNGMGVKLWSSNSRMVNCIVYGNKIEGVATAGDNLQFWGCTIASNAANAIRFESTNTGTSTVRNCIFYNNPNWLFGSTMYNDDYNCYYNSSGSYVIRTSSVTYTAAQVNAHTVPVGAHTIGRDPLFVSPGTADYRLTASSPCNGAGLANSLVALDYYAATRQNPPDIGAIEANGTQTVIPTAPTTVTITPSANVTTATDLTGLAAGSTCSTGATATYSYQWCASTNSGTSWGTWGYAGATLPKANLTAGQMWKTRACATVDNTNYSAWTESAPVTVTGSTSTVAAPTSVAIAPTAPAAGQTLTAAVQPTAPAGVTYSVQWRTSTDSGTTWSAWGWTGSTLAGSNVVAGNQWQAQACASDGTTTSAWTLSAVVTVPGTTTTNQAPSAPTSLAISPAAPQDGDTLVPKASGSVDPDGTAVTYEYRWYYSKDGGVTWTAYGTLATISSGLTGPGEKWKVEARATDGSLYSAWACWSTVTIGSSGTTNLPPTAPTSVAVSPAAPRDNNDLSPVVSGAVDPEGRTVTYLCRWYYSRNAGATWTLYGTTRVLTQRATRVGDLWRVDARAYDGTQYGPATMSAAVTIASNTGTNQAPSAPTSVTISPAAPHDGDNLIPKATGSVDPEGKTVTYQYRWYYSQDGGYTWTLYGTVASLTAGLTGVGEQWKVEARAYDGSLYSPWKLAAPVTIAN